MRLSVFFFILILPLAGFLAGKVSLYNISLFEPAIFIEVSKVTPGELKVYWDTGSGFNEDETTIRRTGEYRHQRLRFPLPEELQAVRLDTDVLGQKLFIRSVRLGIFYWPSIRQLEGDQLREGYQTEVTSDKAHWIISIQEDAYDPYVFLDFGENWQGAMARQRLLFTLSLPLIACLTIGFIGGLYFLQQKRRAKEGS